MSKCDSTMFKDLAKCHFFFFFRGDGKIYIYDEREDRVIDGERRVKCVYGEC